MATTNPFDLLGDDAEDPITADQLKAAAAALPKKDQPKTGARGGAAAAQQSKPAQLPSKPLPPTQAVREARNDAPRSARGGGRGGGGGFVRGRGGGGGGRGFGREFSNGENPSAPANQGGFEEGDSRNPSERRGYGGPRGPYHGGGRRGGFSNDEVGEHGRPRRAFERHSGTVQGNEFKRDGAGRGNWGTHADEITQVTGEVVDETEKNFGDEKPAGEEDATEGKKDSPPNENEEKESEDKEMTLEEYEKVLEEKRKALQALKTEATRKVDTKEFASMQLLSNKKDNDEIFAKLGSDKDKRKDPFEKEEKSKKSLHIHEFLKPAEGERYYNSGGRGRGRGRGLRGGYGGNAYNNMQAPSIEDPGQFPTLGGK